MLSSLFQPGNRKLVMTIIAVVGAILLEKFGGGLSSELKQMILSALGIYAGTNVLSKGIHAIESVKTTKLQETAQEVVTDHGPQIQKIVEYVNNLDKAVGTKVQEIEARLNTPQEEAEDVGSRIDELEKRIDVTTNNVTKLIDLVNRLGAANGPAQQHR